jgi:hypothetical protein
MINVDFTLADFDTVSLLTPVTPAANEWVAAHVPETALRWGGGLAIEASNVSLMVHEIDECGLNVAVA